NGRLLRCPLPDGPGGPGNAGGTPRFSRIGGTSTQLAHRPALWTGRGGSDRPAQIQLRSVGRHGQHRQPYGEPWIGGSDPGHRPVGGPSRPGIRHRTPGKGRDQGQGGDAHLVPGGGATGGRRADVNPGGGPFYTSRAVSPILSREVSSP